MRRASRRTLLALLALLLVPSGALAAFPNGASSRLQLRVIGSTMGTRAELASLVTLLDASGARPLIDRTLPMDQARDGFAAMAEGDVFGKIVFTR